MTALILLVLYWARQIHLRPVVAGSEQLVGATAEALEDFEQRGPVRAHSEIWDAESPVPVRRGDPLRVVGREGLTLQVEPASKEGQ